MIPPHIPPGCTHSTRSFVSVQYPRQGTNLPLDLTLYYRTDALLSRLFATELVIRIDVPSLQLHLQQGLPINTDPLTSPIFSIYRTGNDASGPFQGVSTEDLDSTVHNAFYSIEPRLPTESHLFPKWFCRYASKVCHLLTHPELPPDVRLDLLSTELPQAKAAIAPYAQALTAQFWPAFRQTIPITQAEDILAYMQYLGLPRSLYTPFISLVQYQLAQIQSFEQTETIERTQQNAAFFTKRGTLFYHRKEVGAIRTEQLADSQALTHQEAQEWQTFEQHERTMRAFTQWFESEHGKAQTQNANDHRNFLWQVFHLQNTLSYQSLCRHESAHFAQMQRIHLSILQRFNEEKRLLHYHRQRQYTYLQRLNDFYAPVNRCVSSLRTQLLPRIQTLERSEDLARFCKERDYGEEHQSLLTQIRIPQQALVPSYFKRLEKERIDAKRALTESMKPKLKFLQTTCAEWIKCMHLMGTWQTLERKGRQFLWDCRALPLEEAESRSTVDSEETRRRQLLHSRYQDSRDRVLKATAQKISAIANQLATERVEREALHTRFDREAALPLLQFIQQEFRTVAIHPWAPLLHRELVKARQILDAFRLHNPLVLIYDTFRSLSSAELFCETDPRHKAQLLQACHLHLQARNVDRLVCQTYGFTNFIINLFGAAHALMEVLAHVTYLSTEAWEAFMQILDEQPCLSSHLRQKIRKSYPALSITPQDLVAEFPFPHTEKTLQKLDQLLKQCTAMQGLHTRFPIPKEHQFFIDQFSKFLKEVPDVVRISLAQYCNILRESTPSLEEQAHLDQIYALLGQCFVRTEDRLLFAPITTSEERVKFIHTWETMVTKNQFFAMCISLFTKDAAETFTQFMQLDEAHRPWVQKWWQRQAHQSPRSTSPSKDLYSACYSVAIQQIHAQIRLGTRWSQEILIRDMVQVLHEHQPEESAWTALYQRFETQLKTDILAKWKGVIGAFNHLNTYTQRLLKIHRSVTNPLPTVVQCMGTDCSLTDAFISLHTRGSPEDTPKMLESILDMLQQNLTSADNTQLLAEVTQELAKRFTTDKPPPGPVSPIHRAKTTPHPLTRTLFEIKAELFVYPKDLQTHTFMPHLVQHLQEIEHPFQFQFHRGFLITMFQYSMLALNTRGQSLVGESQIEDIVRSFMDYFDQCSTLQQAFVLQHLKPDAEALWTYVRYILTIHNLAANLWVAFSRYPVHQAKELNAFFRRKQAKAADIPQKYWDLFTPKTRERLSFTMVCDCFVAPFSKEGTPQYFQRLQDQLSDVSRALRRIPQKAR